MCLWDTYITAGGFGCGCLDSILPVVQQVGRCYRWPWLRIAWWVALTSGPVSVQVYVQEVYLFCNPSLCCCWMLLFIPKHNFICFSPWHTPPFTLLSVSDLGVQVQVFGSPQVFRDQQLSPYMKQRKYLSKWLAWMFTICFQVSLLGSAYRKHWNALRFARFPCSYSYFQGAAGFLNKWIKHKEEEEGLSNAPGCSSNTKVKKDTN